MTEVRKLSDGNFGFFATRSYKKGEVIVNEAPLFKNNNDDSAIRAQFSDSSFTSEKSNSKFALAAKMSSSDSSKKSSAQMSSKIRIGQLRGMVTIAASFAISFHQTNEKDMIEKKTQLLSLYHPSLSCQPDELEYDIVQVAQSALEYCANYSKPQSPVSIMMSQETTKIELLKVMLIWACNAFEGGCLYQYSCRINHSCDPNCIAADNRDNNIQIVKAVCSISPGDELLISYLGLFTWVGGSARQKRLLQTKHFLCQCSRCSSEEIASAIPCPSCHPRQGPGSKYLEEHIQWDDDDDIKVSYAFPKNASCDTSSYRGSVCSESTQYNKSPILKIGKKVIDKILNHVESVSGQALSVAEKIGHEELASINTEIDEQLYQLASSVLGARHWTTNLMLLSLLDRLLASFNAIMLLGQDLPDMSELAEAIDSLQRLWKYGSGLSLNMDASFLLYNQTIGIARTLVALGDVNSMKYGAEWAGKVEDYINNFQGEDMKKVVGALRTAWERPIDEKSNDQNNMDIDADESNRTKKRLKK